MAAAGDRRRGLPRAGDARVDDKDVVVLEPTRVGKEAVAIARVVVLPAHGFSILQITSYVPGRGEVDPLKARSIEEAARIYRETPANRMRTTNFGAGLFAPYGGTDGGTVTTA